MIEERISKGREIKESFLGKIQLHFPSFAATFCFNQVGLRDFP